MISEKLLCRLLEFRAERDWEKFHTPKNLAIAINLEASELLENFQWSSEGDFLNEEQITNIEQEIADIVILANYLASDLNLSLEDAVNKKMQINAEKYPVSKSKGRSEKYDRL